MNETAPIKWLNEPEEHDYPAAQSYLELIYEEAIARNYVQELRAAGMSSFMAKDIFRASARRFSASVASATNATARRSLLASPCRPCSSCATRAMAR